MKRTKRFPALFLALFVLISFSFVACGKKEKQPQKMKVLVENLSGNLWKFNIIQVPGRSKTFENLPTGLYERAKAKGKHEMRIGMVLLAKANTFFNQEGIKLYQESHPRDILWIERSGSPSNDFVWLFLEKGTKPDPKFITIVE